MADAPLGFQLHGAGRVRAVRAVAVHPAGARVQRPARLPHPALHRLPQPRRRSSAATRRAAAGTGSADMCEHCGCRGVPPIAELMDEHLALLDEAHHVRRALGAGDRTAAMRTPRRPGAPPGPARAPRGGRHLRRAARRRRVRRGGGPAGGRAPRVRRRDRRAGPRRARPRGQGRPSCSRELDDHVERENLGIFPVSVVTLGATGWELVDRAHAETPTFLPDPARDRGQPVGVTIGSGGAGHPVGWWAQEDPPPGSTAEGGQHDASRDRGARRRALRRLGRHQRQRHEPLDHRRRWSSSSCSPWWSRSRTRARTSSRPAGPVVSAAQRAVPARRDGRQLDGLAARRRSPAWSRRGRRCPTASRRTSPPGSTSSACSPSPRSSWSSAPASCSPSGARRGGTPRRSATSSTRCTCGASSCSSPSW